jgi:hypothetical protein
MWRNTRWSYPAYQWHFSSCAVQAWICHKIMWRDAARTSNVDLARALAGPSQPSHPQPQPVVCGRQEIPVRAQQWPAPDPANAEGVPRGTLTLTLTGSPLYSDRERLSSTYWSAHQAGADVRAGSMCPPGFKQPHKKMTSNPERRSLGPRDSHMDRRIQSARV